MRLAIVVLLLAGCLVGQTTPKQFGQTNIDPITGKPQQYGIVAPDSLHAGDCYRVKQDGTLEKVDECYSKSEIVTWGSIRSGTNTRQGDESYPVDVPAVKSEAKEVKNWRDCPENAMLGTDPDKGMYICQTPETFPHCTDPNRILIGRDGHDQAWCHLPQK